VEEVVAAMVGLAIEAQSARLVAKRDNGEIMM